MDNAGAMALWADDGVTLLPGMAPIAGKKTIAKWLDDVVANMPGYKVTQQENEFRDIQVSGDWASEWGTTHQVVQPPNGKAPIEGYGKILLVLHRDESGEWKIKEEMWNAGVKP
jgi:ketosteroid isomerase-like protein